MGAALMGAAVGAAVAWADDGAGPFVAARTRKHRYDRVRGARGFMLVVGAGAKRRIWNERSGGAELGEEG